MDDSNSSSTTSNIKLLVENLDDISNYCRLCLTTNKIIRNIFSNDHNNWVENDISSQIFYCININIQVNSKMCLYPHSYHLSIVNYRKKRKFYNSYLFVKINKKEYSSKHISMDKLLYVFTLYKYHKFRNNKKFK